MQLELLKSEEAFAAFKPLKRQDSFFRVLRTRIVHFYPLPYNPYGYQQNPLPASLLDEPRRLRAAPTPRGRVAGSPRVDCEHVPPALMASWPRGVVVA